MILCKILIKLCTDFPETYFEIKITPTTTQFAQAKMNHLESNLEFTEKKLWLNLTTFLFLKF